MKKNTTLLLKIFQMGEMGQPLYRTVSPLFQISVYETNFQRPLKKIVNNPSIDYEKIKKNFERILILYSTHQSNARQSVLVNTKRNDLIQYFNNLGKKSIVYVLRLYQINQFVPTKHLVQQIDSVIQNKTKNMNVKNWSKKQNNGNRIEYFNNSVLFPFNLTEWENTLSAAFPKTKNLRAYTFEKSYFFMQTTNLYMIRFSRNPQLMYEDMKDFDAYLSKFNFVRFFWQLHQNNEFMAQKNCQRLIKSLKWRTSQTEQYLLLLTRQYNWEKFILHVQDFCICYQSLHEAKQNNIKNLGQQ